MMREIKFRVWAQDSKFGPCMLVQGMTIMELINDACESLELPIELNDNECKWMQFTGLLDKNGEEIYEGDIVHVFWGDLQGTKEDIVVVKYRNGYHFPDSGAHTYNQLITVIGNIYENPELLKQL